MQSSLLIVHYLLLVLLFFRWWDADQYSRDGDNTPRRSRTCTTGGVFVERFCLVLQQFCSGGMHTAVAMIDPRVMCSALSWTGL